MVLDRGDGTSDSDLWRSFYLRTAESGKLDLTNHGSPQHGRTNLPNQVGSLSIGHHAHVSCDKPGYKPLNCGIFA